MSDITLRNCPFCGGSASLKFANTTEEYFVDCDLEKETCAVIPSTWFYETEEEAIEAWNRRDGDR